MKVRRKYILSFSIVLAVVSLILSAVQFNRTKESLLESNQFFFRTIVNASYDIVDTTVNEAIKTYLKGVTDTVASHTLRVTPEQEVEEVIRIANELVIGESGYIYLMSPQGIHLYHPFLQGKNRAHLTHIQQQLSLQSGMTQYSHANPHEVGKRAKVAYSVRLPSGNTLVATTYKDELMYLVDLEALKEKLRKYSYGDSGYVYIVDLQGTLVLQPNFEHEHLKTLIDDSSELLIDKVVDEPEGHFSYSISTVDGTTSKNIFYKFYPYLNWVISAGVLEQELNKNHSLLLASLMTLVVSLLSIIVVLVLYLRHRHLKILDVASLDYLTGLPSRRSFIEQLKLKMAQRSPYPLTNVGVILLDIDHFKRVNDQYGHAQGDRVICEVAKSLKRFVNRRRLIARYGGEEFILVTFDCDERELFELSEKLRRSVEQQQGLVSPVTISAGCCHDRAITDIETAIDKADKALYQAKERGRNNTQTYQKNEYRVAYM
ncbi:diguanylate cyclase [Vibrio lentus]|uniref:diguanylate cyclase n=1 Tax=Vibrio lentus TaxID=136468 RepID=A0AB36XM82_9VIBR|nr:sensor domain-containing diguanylate cyclase [Vibrio lentus]MCC4836127.1 diguanylate cyclase [Vibrio lentus]PMI15979.1 diguanylate cyclase [Vibrio lentus]PMK31027.1 diguanylate cyclase [Vibrio lentus]PMK47189.1 diguanylate cyclase [Vibrio lentus]PML32810.1 diguanylate cyclase [Vibrio lentus]